MALSTSCYRSDLVIGIILCLLVHSQGHSNPFFTLYCQNMSLKVKGEQISLSLGRPTVYSLITSEYYQNPGSTDLEDLSISLQAVASGKLICVNKKGKVYLEPIRMEKDPGGKPVKSLRPRKNCLFKALKFSSLYIYRDARAIFCPAHSNSSSGQFLSFSPNGTISGVGRRYDALSSKGDNWIKLDLPVANAKLRNVYLRSTRFSRNDNKFDDKVRKCVQRVQPGLFPSAAPRKRRGKGVAKGLKQGIAKCRRRIERKFGEDRIRFKLEMEAPGSNDVEDDDEGNFVKGKNKRGQRKLGGSRQKW